MAAIQFEHVTKRFGKLTVIEDANLEIRDREVLVLVGPSGCGKSTLLRMIAGLEEITEGTLHLDGQVVNHLPPKDRDIAIVFQNYALYPHMTAFDNLAFALKIRGWDKARIREKVQQVARMLEIEPLLDRKPKAMSGGQRQRVAIGRAMVRNPKVFLFDEPLSNLDAKLRGQMRLEIARLHRELQATVVYVTHDQVEAMTLGDRIAIIQAGRILQVDTPHAVYNKPVNKFVAGFIGSPPMNFLQGRISLSTGEPVFIDESGNFVARDLPVPGLSVYDNRPVILGLRPEHLHAGEPPAGIPVTRLTANVQLVERLGHESFAFTEMGGQSLTVRIPADVDIQPDTKIDLHAENGRMFFFDPDTELAI